MTVSMTAKIAAGATLHPVLNIGKYYFVSSGGGPGGGRSRGGGRPGGGEVRPPVGPPGRGGSAGLVCLDEAGAVLWKTGNEPDVGGGSIINAGGVLISQNGGDGSLRLIKPGAAYQELAVGKVFDKDPGSEIWAPMAFCGRQARHAQPGSGGVRGPGRGGGRRVGAPGGRHAARWRDPGAAAGSAR